MYLFTNNATATLASSITAAATTIPLASGTGSLFPSPTAPDIFHATLADVAGNTEIVRVTSRSTDTLTVVRGQEGTVARNFAAGDRVELRLTAAALNSLAQVDSQAFTGTPSAPTPALGDDSTRLATTAFVKAQVADAAPTKAGAGATGTWPVSVTGSAGSAGSASTSTTQAAKNSSTAIATTEFVDRLRSLLASSTAGTLALSDRGCLVKVTSTITVPSGVFESNDVVTIYNDTGANVSVAQGSGLTLRFAGTATTGTRTLAQRALATVVFVSPTEAVISGAGLS